MLSHELLVRWKDGGREEWIPQYIESCELATLAELVDVGRCKPSENDDFVDFAWDGHPIKEGKTEYTLVLHALLMAFDYLTMECLSQYPKVVQTLSQPHNETDRINQLTAGLSSSCRRENVLVLLDAYEPLLTNLEGHAGFHSQLMEPGTEIINSVWTRGSGTETKRIQDDQTNEILERLQPFVHNAFACSVSGEKHMLVLYFRSNRTTAKDMGPLSEGGFRQRIVNAFDIILGDFNAVAEQAQAVVTALAADMKHPTGRQRLDKTLPVPGGGHWDTEMAHSIPNTATQVR